MNDEAREAKAVAHLYELMAFIEDVKVCEHCDTRNLNKVIYCKGHQGALDRMPKEV